MLSYEGISESEALQFHNDDQRYTPRDTNDDNDDSGSIETRTNHSGSVSMQLSLPDSFDDTMWINGVPIPSGDHIQTDDLLQAQLLESRQKIRQLCEETESQMIVFGEGINIPTDEEYEQIKIVPHDKRNLVQSARLAVYRTILEQRREHTLNREKYKNELELVNQEKEEAFKAKNIYKQRESKLENQIETSKNRQAALEEKVLELQETVMKLSEKGRTYDEIESRNGALRGEIVTIRKVIDQKQKETDNAKHNEDNDRIKLKDLETNNQALQMDKTFLQKEKALLLERVNASDQTYKHNEAEVYNIKAKCDDLTIQLAEANISAKSDGHMRVANEIKRMQEENKKELGAHKNQVEAAYQKETKLLMESKNSLASQCDDTKVEMKRLYHVLETTIADKEGKSTKLETCLSESCDELQAKRIENSRLCISNESLEKNVRAMQKKGDMLTNQVEAHKKEFKNLERESIFERKRYAEEILRKDRQLEMYFQSELQNLDKKGGKQKETHSTHLLEKASALTHECNRLQRIAEALQFELKIQVSKTVKIEAKLSAANVARNSASKQVESLVSSGKMKNDEKLSQLITQNNAFRDEMLRAREDKDKMTKQFNNILQRYHQLAEMRNNDHKICSTTQSPNLQIRTREKNLNKNPSPVVFRNNDDISIHFSRRGMAPKKPWHTKIM